jgi:tetratricopeptide (TPR) repeat protein
MSFEYWLDRLRRRFGGDLLGQTVLAEAVELWRAAQPADPTRPTRAEAARLATAAEWLGRLHAHRYSAVPEGAGQHDLAAAIVYLMSAGVSTVPEPLRRLLGAEADLEQQSITANALLEQAARTGDRVLFQASVQLHHATLTDRGPRRAVRLSNLALAFRARFTRVGDADDADRAVEFGEQAIAALVAGDQNAALILSNVGAVYLARFDRTGRPADLDRAIQLCEWAVAAVDPDDPHRAVCLFNVCSGYYSRFDLTGNLADIDRSIEVGEQAMTGLARQDPTMLSGLGFAYRARFERTGQLSDLDRAIAIGQRAVTVGADDPNYALRLSNLGLAYHSRFQRSGDLTDVDRAIACHQQAVAVMPSDDPDRALRHTNLGTAYLARFVRIGDVSDLERAVEHQSQAVAASQDDRPQRAIFLGNLGLACQARFERYGEVADVDRAIEHMEHAVAVTPDNHSEGALRLSNLGHAYQVRFGRVGRLSDLDRAIESHQRAFDATPADHPQHARHLANLGSALHARFEQNGNTDDLDRAVEAAKQAVAVTPVDHPDLVSHLSNLGASYAARFERIGSMADVDLAIVHQERVVAATPADHPELGRYLSNLGATYDSRFHRTFVVSDVDSAVAVHERAVAVTPLDHPERTRRLFNLGAAYRARGEHTAQVADLDRAVDVAHQVLAAANGQALYWFILGRSFHTRGLITGDVADLDAAIDHYRRAIAETPADDPRRAARLYYLGRCYEYRGGVGTDEIAALAEQAVAATTGRPYDRVRACWVFGWLAHKLGDLNTARRALDVAVSLLPSIPAREIARADQERQLSATRGVVAETIAVHCELGDLAGAVEIGEQGRGILLAAQLDLRTSLGGLEPTLARRFHLARERLNAPDPADEDVVGQRKRLWAEYDAVLAEVRAHGVALPPTWGELWQSVAGRTVVLVNASGLRGDAVVLSAGWPVHVPLPSLRFADVVRHAVALREATHDPSGLTGELRRQRVLTELLGWLWDVAVGPVLDVVEQSRVWWLPTGVLGLLPLHAAGHVGAPGALDWVVSSYTPTLRVLARSIDRPATARRQLTVALERTPGLADLPATVAEAAGLPADLPPLINELATVSQVRAALPGASWAHFACHASTNPETPSTGGLHLHDGVLPISEVSRLDLPDAELAYLSACSTGHAGRHHADESIHLASAFQLAGFRHVIAGLWPLDDRIAATAADRFYHRMSAEPSADGAAHALHEVALEMRAEHTDRPHLWAPLIHSGP